MTVNDYFGAVLFINLVSRTDRLARCQSQFEQHRISARRINGIVDRDPRRGCFLSHMQAYWIACQIDRPTLILEDDFEIIHDDFQDRFAKVAPGIPDYDILYLGGNYRGTPWKSVAFEIRQTWGLSTTSSYAVTPDHAFRLLHSLEFTAPIDDLLIARTETDRHLVVHPRLIRQAPGRSDIELRDVDYRNEMTDLI